jgi:hypothetical protein
LIRNARAHASTTNNHDVGRLFHNLKT